MNFKKIYIVQIIVILVVLLCICIQNLYEPDKDKEVFKKYINGELDKIQEQYESNKEYYNYNEIYFDSTNFELDKNGVLLSSYNGEKIYIPSDIAYYGLMLYSRYIQNGDSSFYIAAKKQADFLINEQNKDTGCIYCRYNTNTIPGTGYDMKNVWASATVQGQALSLFSRIYSVSNEEKYKYACELALIPYEKEAVKSGVYADLLGYSFYEEFPTRIPNYTLTGHLYSLIGLYDYNELIGDSKAKELFDKGIETLKFCLPLYDDNGYALYNLGFIKYERNQKYHSAESHCKYIGLLETLNKIEKNEVFEYFINKWKQFIVSNL